MKHNYICQSFLFFCIVGGLHACRSEKRAELDQGTALHDARGRGVQDVLSPDAPAAPVEVTSLESDQKPVEPEVSQENAVSHIEELKTKRREELENYRKEIFSIRLTGQGERDRRDAWEALAPLPTIVD